MTGDGELVKKTTSNGSLQKKLLHFYLYLLSGLIWILGPFTGILMLNERPWDKHKRRSEAESWHGIRWVVFSCVTIVLALIAGTQYVEGVLSKALEVECWIYTGTWFWIALHYAWVTFSVDYERKFPTEVGVSSKTRG